MSIDNWFSINTNNKKISQPIFMFKYFYIIWNTNKDYSVQWLNTKPAKYNYEKSIRLRDINETITFIGNINYDLESSSLIKDTQCFYCKNNQFLKSHLQKCVRRGKHYKAICTAYQLIENNPVDFLRRLPIIALEDVHIIKDIDIIVWFMVMSQYIKLPESLKRWLLYIVKFISLYPKKNYYDKTIDKPDLNSLNNIPIKFRSTIYSLLIRKCYGGMKGDIKMINYIIDNWIKKLASGEELITIKCKNVIILKTLDVDMYEISALDFHCYRKILDIINDKYPQFEKKFIKKTIWEKSSKINFRENIKKSELEIENCWTMIKDYLQKIQKSVIKKYIWKNYNKINMQ